MAFRIFSGVSDEVIDRIRDALRPFEVEHPEAQIDIYRYNSVCVRVRIIDPWFAGLDFLGRRELIGKWLESLDDDAYTEISMTVLLTPGEARRSFVNRKFEDPVGYESLS